MPRDGSGNYTLPYPAVVDGTTIESAVHNGTMSDIATQLNGPLPIIAGGTGANNAHDARVALGAEVSNQVVTNYDTHVFENGSFYSAPGATGAPDGSNYYDGIAYSFTPGYVTLHAHNYNGTSGVYYTRQKVSGTWGAWVQDFRGAPDLDARYVNLSGDTMTGGLIIDRTAPAAASVLTLDAGTSNQAGIIFSENHVGKWQWLKQAAGDQLLVYDYPNAMTAFALTGSSKNISVNYTTASTSPTTGALTVAGGVGVAGQVYISGSANAQLMLEATGASYAVARWKNPAKAFQLALDPANNLNFYDETRAAPALSISGAAGVVNIPSTTASTTKTTGALTIAGGLGVAGDVNASVLVANGGAIWAQTTATTGTLQFGSSGTKYINYDGTQFVIATGNLFVNGRNIGTGYISRAGETGGMNLADCHNHYWTGTLQAYINSTLVGTVTLTSDYRIKKDVIDLPGMWDTVKALRPIKYTHQDFTPQKETARRVEMVAKARENGEDVPYAKEGYVIPPFVPGDSVERWGFIAHELQDTLTPSVASGVKDDPDAIQALNIDGVVAALTKALQEAMARIEALEAR